MIRVDGVNIKENTYYTMLNGEVVETKQKSINQARGTPLPDYELIE